MENDILIYKSVLNLIQKEVDIPDDDLEKFNLEVYNQEEKTEKSNEIIRNFIQDLKNVINNDKEHMIAEKINFSYLF